MTMTKSKTKLLTMDRKFSVKRAVVEKVILDIYAELGWRIPRTRKKRNTKKKVA